MWRIGYTAIVTVGVAVSGCTGLTDYSAASEGGYYGPTPGYYGGPYYAAPYPRGYVHPRPYPGPWQGYSGWNERYGHGYNANGYRDGGRPPPGPPPGPPVAVAPPRPVAPPPSAPPQAAQNKALLDQLGFRPSH